MAHSDGRDQRVRMPGGLWVLEITGGPRIGEFLVMLQARNISAAGIGALLSTYFEHATPSAEYQIKAWPA